MARLSDGTLVVANSGSSELRVFDSRGAFRRSIGRAGRGPGDFQKLRSLQRSADALFAVDEQLRVQVYRPDGQLLRSQTYPRPGGFSIGDWLGWWPSGDAAFLANVAPVPVAQGPHRQMTAPLLVSSSGVVRTSPVRIGGWDYVADNDGRPTIVAYTPSPHGAVTESRLWIGYGDTLELLVLDAGGRTVMRVVRDVEAAAVTDADREYYEGLLLGYAKTVRPEVREFLRDQSKHRTFARSHPAFSALRAAPDGRVWVCVSRRGLAARQRYPSPSWPTTWMVIDSAGAWIADVVLPQRFVPMDIGRDYVAGVFRDDDDVESVAVLRVSR